MAPEIQERIFEPFFSTKAEKGTGLGLSVSHWILRRHDAQIELDSELGGGTSFRIIFAPTRDARHVRRLAAKPSLNILVVDDDQTVAEMVADILGEENHQVTIVTNANQALATVRNCATDLVITDLDLPDMGGWQLARELRDAREDLLVGLMTGWPLDVSDEELRARGADFTLRKPFTPKALQGVLRKLREL
jgi:CheY-like chemotaxis protein